MNSEKKMLLSEDAMDRVTGGAGNTAAAGTASAPVMHYNDLGEPIPEFRYDDSEPEELSPDLQL